MRRIFLLVVLLAVLAVAYLLLSPFGPSRETFVEVAPGTSARQIGKELEKQGIIRSRYAFYLWRVTAGSSAGGTLKAGEYRFDHPARIGDVYDRIRRGDVFTVPLTIPEGSNIFDIAARAAAALSPAANTATPGNRCSRQSASAAATKTIPSRSASFWK